MISERDLLAILCHFISTKQIVRGDENSIQDMVVRYKFPPFTIAFPVCIRLTIQEYNQLNEILKQAYELLSATETVYPSDGMIETLKKDYDKNLIGQLKRDTD